MTAVLGGAAADTEPDTRGAGAGQGGRPAIGRPLLQRSAALYTDLPVLPGTSNTYTVIGINLKTENRF